MEIVIAGAIFLFVLGGLYFVIKAAVADGINSSSEIKKVKAELRLLNKQINKEAGRNKVDKKV